MPQITECNYPWISLGQIIWVYPILLNKIFRPCRRMMWRFQHRSRRSHILPMIHLIYRIPLRRQNTLPPCFPVIIIRIIEVRRLSESLNKLLIPRSSHNIFLKLLLLLPRHRGRFPWLYLRNCSSHVHNCLIKITHTPISCNSLVWGACPLATSKANNFFFTASMSHGGICQSRSGARRYTVA